MAKILSILFAATYLAITAQPAEAEVVAWDKIIGIDLSKLDTAQKKKVETELNQLLNTRGCLGTLAQCLAAGDLTARRHAGFVARMVRRNKDHDFIAKGIKARAASAFPEEILKIDLADHPFDGPAEAKVVLVEYACFQCPFCAHLSPKLEILKKHFKGDLVHYYKFFPVRSHPRGVATALAAFAAHRQNAFWKMHDLMYQNRTNLEEDDLVDYARKAGLDIDKFNADRKSDTAMKFVEKDKLEGMRLGVEGTPTFFVNGKLFDGVQDSEELRDRIAEELDIIAGRIK